MELYGNYSLLCSFKEDFKLTYEYKECMVAQTQNYIL